MKYLSFLLSLSVCFNLAAAVDYSRLSQFKNVPSANSPKTEPTVLEEASAWAKSGLDAASEKSAAYVNPVIAAAISVAAPVVLEASAQVSTPETARVKRIVYVAMAGVSAVLSLLSFNGVQK